MPQLGRSAPKKEKEVRMHDEMSKFKNKTLRSSNGRKVVSRKQAIAIGLSESGQSKRSKKKAFKR